MTFLVKEAYILLWITLVKLCYKNTYLSKTYIECKQSKTDSFKTSNNQNSLLFLKINDSTFQKLTGLCPQ